MAAQRATAGALRRQRGQGWARAAVLLAALPAAPLLAQGTDQPPAQRDQQVIAHWLAGDWDSLEQAYFEGRQRRDGGTEADARDHPRRRLAIAPAGPDRFRVARDGTSVETWTLARDGNTLRLLTDRPGVCPLLLRREAGQFAGQPPSACRGERRTLLLAPGALWEGPGDSRESLTRYRRARQFTCHVDIPGVGGGRNIPFRRHGPFVLPDQGGEAVFETDENPPRTLAIRLRNVAWAYNNAPSGFTRNSLTLYAAELAGGVRRELGYGWTEPGATRIGLNLVQLLANCAMVPADAAAPEF
ncbi:hypothetical protein [Thermaurantiacus sp.]